MGLKKSFCTASIFLFSVSLFAAPKLRLSTTTVGPVRIVQGAATIGPVVEAANVGDGTLNLQVTPSPSATWLTASVGAAHSCSLASQCFPIQLNIASPSLAPGTYSGTVTVSDPNAVDAPQTIVVTAQIGSNVPDRIDFLVKPNGGVSSAIVVTGSKVTSNVTAGQNFLTMALNGAGSFTFDVPYTINVNAANLAAGNYTGSVAITGSTLAADNKTVQVGVTATTSPIAQVTASDTGNCSFAAPQNTQMLTGTVTCRASVGSKPEFALSVGNLGLGTLTVSGVTTAVTSGPNEWLSASNSGNAVTIKMDTANLAAGAYAGTVTINSNAANNAVVVPVKLDVSSSSNPLIYFQGVQNNATFRGGEPVAQGDIVVIKGEQLAPGGIVVANTTPYPTTLNKVQVFVNNTPAPIYYTLPQQLAIQVPYDAALGDAVIKVVADGKTSNLAGVTIVKAAPRILQLIGAWGTVGAIVNAADGSLPFPSNLSPIGDFTVHPAKIGDTILVYAIGFGQTDPPVVTGDAAPSNPLARVAGYKAVFGGGFSGSSVTVTPIFTGLAPTFAGLYQINVTIPEGAPTGSAVPLILVGPDGSTNQTTIAIQ